AAYLADLGYEVELAEDGPSALDAIARLHPALILADAALPGLEPEALVEAVRQHPEWGSPRVLLLVGALTRLRPEQAAAADGVLRKPLSSAGLQPWLEKLAAGRATDASAAPPLAPEQMLERALREAVAGL
ncbi:MAG: response regulator, partial [Terriglobales bacterium]